MYRRKIMASEKFNYVIKLAESVGLKLIDFGKQSHKNFRYMVMLDQQGVFTSGNLLTVKNFLLDIKMQIMYAENQQVS
jgi:hypothetical protein